MMTQRGIQVGRDFKAILGSPWVVPLTWASVLAVYSLLIFANVVEGRAAQWLTNAGWTISSGLAALACWRTSRLLLAQRRTAWRLFAAACAVWFLGQLAWDWDVLVAGTDSPFPGLADLGYVGYTIFFTAGLLYYRAAQLSRRVAPQRLANLSLILCSLAVVLHSMLVEPLALTRRPGTFVVAALTEGLSYAATFLVAVYSMWSYRWQRDLRPMLLVVASLTVHGLCILAYAHRLLLEYPATDLLNIGWIVAFALQHWAAATQIRADPAITPAQDIYQGEGWIEALLPASLLLFIAFTILLDDASHLGAGWVQIALIAVFAIILAYRETWMYLRGLQLKWRLEHMQSSLENAEEQLRHTASALQELQQHIELVARAGGVGLWDWNLRTHEVRYSNEWKHQLGYAENELQNDSLEWRRRLHPDDADRAIAALNRFLENPTGEFTLEARLRHRDGSYRYMLSRATVLRDVAGTPTRMLSSHVDITPLKETEVALRDSEARFRELASELEQRVSQRTAELSEALRDSRSFAYAVAHDLRSPLRAIHSFSQLLKESSEARLTDTEKGHIERVRNGAVQMASLIEGLLAYSRIEHYAMHLEPVDLLSSIREVLAAIAVDPRTNQSHIEVNVEPLQVLADREGLQVVFRNLIDNALKFTRAAEQPRISIGAARRSASVLVWVKDNGIGFDQAYHDKIFGIFERLHSDSSIEGTGIGLALAHKAVQRMRGRIWAKSVLGKGATFYVELSSVTVPFSTSHSPSAAHPG